MSSTPLAKDAGPTLTKRRIETIQTPATRIDAVPRASENVRLFAATGVTHVETRPSIKERIMLKVPTRDQLPALAKENWYLLAGSATALTVALLGGGFIGAALAGGFMYAASYLKLNPYLKGAAVASVLLFHFGLTILPFLALAGFMLWQHYLGEHGTTRHA